MNPTESNNVKNEIPIKVTPWIKRLVKSALSHSIPIKMRAQIGGFLLMDALGEGNDNSLTNGEFFILDFVKAHARDLNNTPPTFMDVGANIGEWTLHAAADCGSDSQIFALEPSYTTFNLLKENFDSHAKKGSEIKPFNIGLSDSSCTRSLHTYHQGAGSNSLYHRKPVGNAAVQTSLESIELVRGDEFIDLNQITFVHMLKIDTEGHEIAVLRGLLAALKRNQIGLLQFEYGGTWIDSRSYLFEAFEILEAQGYQLGKLFPDRIELISKYSSSLESFRYANFVAFTRSAAELFLKHGILSTRVFGSEDNR